VTVRGETAAPRYGKIAYYSVDDGKSYFEDSNTKIPPFDYGGKQAYRVHVFSCDGGKTTWVSHLESWKPEARAKLEGIRAIEKQLAEKPDPNVPRDKDPMYLLPALAKTNLMVKKPDVPGQPPNTWVTEAEDAGAYHKTRGLTCPHGNENHLITPVLP
jgi:hypothetical protein